MSMPKAFALSDAALERLLCGFCPGDPLSWKVRGGEEDEGEIEDALTERSTSPEITGTSVVIMGAFWIIVEAIVQLCEYYGCVREALAVENLKAVQ